MTMQRILRLLKDYGPIHQEGKLIASRLSKSDLYLEVAPPIPKETGDVLIRSLVGEPPYTNSLVPQHILVAAGPGLYRARHDIVKRKDDVIVNIQKGELVEVTQTGVNPLHHYFLSFAPCRPWSIKQLKGTGQTITCDPKSLELIDNPTAQTIALAEATSLGLLAGVSSGLFRAPAPAPNPALYQTLAAIVGPVADLAAAVTELPPSYEVLEEEGGRRGEGEEGGAGDTALAQRETQDAFQSMRERAESEDAGNDATLDQRASEDTGHTTHEQGEFEDADLPPPPDYSRGSEGEWESSSAEDPLPAYTPPVFVRSSSQISLPLF